MVFIQDDASSSTLMPSTPPRASSQIVLQQYYPQKPTKSHQHHQHHQQQRLPSSPASQDVHNHLCVGGGKDRTISTTKQAETRLVIDLSDQGDISNDGDDDGHSIGSPFTEATVESIETSPSMAASTSTLISLHQSQKLSWQGHPRISHLSLRNIKAHFCDVSQWAHHNFHHQNPHQATNNLVRELLVPLPMEHLRQMYVGLNDESKTQNTIFPIPVRTVSIRVRVDKSNAEILESAKAAIQGRSRLFPCRQSNQFQAMVTAHDDQSSFLLDAQLCVDATSKFLERILLLRLYHRDPQQSKQIHHGNASHKAPYACHPWLNQLVQASELIQGAPDSSTLANANVNADADRSAVRLPLLSQVDRSLYQASQDTLCSIIQHLRNAESSYHAETNWCIHPEDPILLHPDFMQQASHAGGLTVPDYLSSIVCQELQMDMEHMQASLVAFAFTLMPTMVRYGMNVVKLLRGMPKICSGVVGSCFGMGANIEDGNGECQGCHADEESTQWDNYHTKMLEVLDYSYQVEEFQRRVVRKVGKCAIFQAEFASSMTAKLGNYSSIKGRGDGGGSGSSSRCFISTNYLKKAPLLNIILDVTMVRDDIHCYDASVDAVTTAAELSTTNDVNSNEDGLRCPRFPYCMAVTNRYLMCWIGANERLLQLNIAKVELAMMNWGALTVTDGETTWCLRPESMPALQLYDFLCSLQSLLNG